MDATSRSFDLLRDIAGREEVAIVVSGPCMTPVLADGAKVRVRRARFYRPGDVIAFRSANGPLLVHRLLGYTVDGGRVKLVAKGDRLGSEDAAVTRDQVVGRVVGGDCRQEAYSVPAAVRLGSIARFARTLLRRTLSSWSSANAS